MRGQTYTIGVMLPDIRNPFFADILDGITEQLGGTDYQVLLGPGCNGEDGRGPGHRGDDRPQHGRPHPHRPDLAARATWSTSPRTVPTVVVGRHGLSAAYDTVADDDFAGAALVVDHLVALGHRRIAHIEHPENDPGRLARCPTPIRADGYRQAMRRHGLADDIDIVSTTLHPGGRLPRRPAAARPARAARPPSSPAPTSSPWACSTRSPRPACRCPATSRSPATTTPRSPRFGPISLTSVDQAGHQMGANAARLLLERIADRSRPRPGQALPHPGHPPHHRAAPAVERSAPRDPQPRRSIVRLNRASKVWRNVLAHSRKRLQTRDE